MLPTACYALLYHSSASQFACTIISVRICPGSILDEATHHSMQSDVVLKSVWCGHLDTYQSRIKSRYDSVPSRAPIGTCIHTRRDRAL